MAVHSASRAPAPRALHGDERALPRRATLAVAAGSAAALAVACVMSPTSATHGQVICPFRLVTGLPCPGCGMTRAGVFLMHGDLAAALAANPFVLVALPAAVVAVLVVGFAVVRRQDPPDLGRAISARPAQLVGAAWVVFGVARAIAVATGHASP